MINKHYGGKLKMKERFAKYTNEEIMKGIRRLEAKIAENEEAMEYFKRENNVEFFNVAKEQYEENVQILMDAKYALEVRNNK